MIRFWILKYILYNSFTKKNIASAYFEGGCLGMLTIFPIMSVLMLLGKFNANKLIFIAPLLILINLYATWDDGYVNSKYKFIEQNKRTLSSHFKKVYWFIFLDILFFIITLIIVTIRRNT